MSDHEDKKRGVEGRTPRTEGKEDAMPVRYVREHLKDTERIIRSLKNDIHYYRGQTSEIARERDTLLKSLSEHEHLAEDHNQLSDDFRSLKSDRDKMIREIRTLNQENKRLVNYCARLENELRAEREASAEAQEIIIYLEAQIEQLEGMVAMLREHKSFMRKG